MREADTRGAAGYPQPPTTPSQQLPPPVTLPHRHSHPHPTSPSPQRDSTRDSSVHTPHYSIPQPHLCPDTPFPLSSSHFTATTHHYDSTPHQSTPTMSRHFRLLTSYFLPFLAPPHHQYHAHLHHTIYMTLYHFRHNHA